MVDGHYRILHPGTGPQCRGGGKRPQAVEKGQLFRPSQNRGRHAVLGGLRGQRKDALPYRLCESRYPNLPLLLPEPAVSLQHALGLLFEILADKPFAVAELPQDIADKRAKQAARAAKKEEAGEAGTTAQPKKPNAAAQSKKIKKQLEGLDMAQRMIDDLLAAGLSTLAGTSIQSYEKLAKDLGSYYLTGPQLAFSRLALTVKAIQRDPANAARGYAEASRILVTPSSTIKKARAFLEARLEQGQFTAEDTILYEALGGIWRLEDLRAIGSYKENARLVQLSFDVCYDEARREFVLDRGYWIDADTGEIGQTLHYRPVKALKYVKAEDSCFDLVCVPQLFRYPGSSTAASAGRAAPCSR